MMRAGDSAMTSIIWAFLYCRRNEARVMRAAHKASIREPVVNNTGSGIKNIEIGNMRRSLLNRRALKYIIEGFPAS